MIEKTINYWHEFWWSSYMGELPHSINVNQSAQVAGVSINMWIYGIIGIAFIFWMARSAFTEEPVFKSIFPLIVAFWVLLTFNSQLSLIDMHLNISLIYFIKLFVAIAIPMFIGGLIILLILDHVYLLELVGLSYPVGMGVLMLQAYIFSWIHHPLSFQSFFWASMAIMFFLIAAILQYKKISRIKVEWFPKGFYAWMVVIMILYCFFIALSRGVVIADAKFYTAIAYNIFMEKGIGTALQLSQAGTHPLFIPFAQYWTWETIGGIAPSFGKIVSPMFYMSLIFVFYSKLAGNFSKNEAIVWTFLLTGMVLLTYHARTPYTDMPLAVCYTVAMMYLFEFMAMKDNRDLYISAIFLGLGCHMKASGIPLAVTAITILIFYLLVSEVKKKWLKI